jgi:hypothetical protein
MRYAFYQEEPFCRVANEGDTNGLLGEEKVMNGNMGLLDVDYINSNKHIRSYFNITTTAGKDGLTGLTKYGLDIPDDYLNKGYKIQEKCNVLDNLEFSYLIIALCAPVLYFLTALCLVVIYCKYRKIRNDYQRLQGSEEVHSDPSVHVDQGMEMGNVDN